MDSAEVSARASASVCPNESITSLMLMQKIYTYIHTFMEERSCRAFPHFRLATRVSQVRFSTECGFVRVCVCVRVDDPRADSSDCFFRFKAKKTKMRTSAQISNSLAQTHTHTYINIYACILLLLCKLHAEYWNICAGRLTPKLISLIFSPFHVALLVTHTHTCKQPPARLCVPHLPHPTQLVMQ